jgi:hypothetical protein
MFERVRKTLVKSFVGTLALGWIFAQGILHFAYIFSTPVAGWLTRREYRGLVERPELARGFSLQDALPESARSFSLLVVGYFLLRWLYFKPLEQEPTEPTSEQQG